jgi:hypothetical protein
MFREAYIHALLLPGPALGYKCSFADRIRDQNHIGSWMLLTHISLVAANVTYAWQYIKVSTEAHRTQRRKQALTIYHGYDETDKFVARALLLG